MKEVRFSDGTPVWIAVVAACLGAAIAFPKAGIGGAILGAIVGFIVGFIIGNITLGMIEGVLSKQGRENIRAFFLLVLVAAAVFGFLALIPLLWGVGKP